MKKQQQTDTLIVGAGPAGLAMAGRLSKMNIPYRLLEKAGAWRTLFLRVFNTAERHFAEY